MINARVYLLTKGECYNGVNWRGKNLMAEDASKIGVERPHLHLIPHLISVQGGFVIHISRKA